LIGKKLGHYEVVAQIGAGGMGEVYRARDTRLHREVAIKVIPPRLIDDAAHRERFQREARLLASLNHPNIAAIHGLEEDDGQHFLVLEFVDGSDLHQRLLQGPMSIEDVIAIARQVADAVDNAHRQGVIHRDLKPSNIALTADGTVKVLDFGLAKALDPSEAPGSVSQSQSPTILGAATASNVILGTAAYMSPEQARGSAVDQRADIWAFGCVIFECLCGRRVFDGASISDTLAAVLRDEVDFDTLPPRTPPALRRLLQRCLERDPDRRLNSLSHAVVELDDAETELQKGITHGAQPVPAGGRMTRWIGWGVAVILAAALGVTIMSERSSEGPAPVTTFLISGDSLQLGAPTPPTISPDGRRVVYAAAGQLWLRELDQLRAIPISGTERARGLAWSPDGKDLCFDRDRQILRVPATGGIPIVICETREPVGQSGAIVWCQDDVIVFCSGDGPLYEVPAAGGTPAIMLDMDPDFDDDFHNPAALPGERAIVFVTHLLEGKVNSLDLVSGGRRSRLWEMPGPGSIAHPAWDASGHILFLREGPSSGIWALPFSLDDLEVTGDPFRVTSTASPPSISRDGALVYAQNAPRGNHRVVRVSFDGEIFPDPIDTGEHIDDVAYSPSGSRFLSLLRSGADDVPMVLDVKRNTKTRLGSNASLFNPFWISDTMIGAIEPDSSQIVIFDLEVAAGQHLLYRTAPGIRLSRQSNSPSSDGRFIAFTATAKSRGTDVMLLSIDDPESARSLLASPANERGPQISPDGSLLLWTSDDSGRNEVYVAELSTNGTLGKRRWQVSSLGGDLPRWSHDGSRVFYETEKREIAQVEVTRDDGIGLSRPRTLFALAPMQLQLHHGYSVTPDNMGFVITQSAGAEDSELGIVVVQNWYEAFRNR